MIAASRQYARDLWHGSLDGWNRFWFTPADPATLGLVRICTGLMLLYTHAVWALDLRAFFGPDSWLSPELAAELNPSRFHWALGLWPGSMGVLWIVHGFALAVFALLTLGLFSRVTSVLAFLLTVAYIQRAEGALFGLDRINTFLSMYLMVGPCGAAYSLDRLLARRRFGASGPAAPSVSANIAVRLIQLHMCLVYLFAGLAKLQGVTWWDGTAMWYALANGEYQSLDMTWLANSSAGEIICNVLTHVTIAWEIFYCALVWPRLTRPIVVAMAIPLHLGIGIFLGMITFGLVMLIGNLAFVSPALVRSVLGRAGGP
jgi:hypothetical protein